MSFVHGHSRDTPDDATGDVIWVRSHHRAPHRPDDGQLMFPDEADSEADAVAEQDEAFSRAAAPASGGARAGLG